MDNRLLVRPLGFSSINENSLIALKNSTMEDTPRKLPFKDSTNKELMKSVAKQEKPGVEKNQTKQEQASSSKEAESVAASSDDYDDLPFVFPTDKNCFCCGSDRKTDGEVWGEKLALSDEFWEKILNADIRMPEHFPEKFSPIKPLFIPPLVYMPEPAEELPFNVSLPLINESASDISDDLDSSLEVPDIDFDFSMGGFNASNNVDDSIIQDW